MIVTQYHCLVVVWFISIIIKSIEERPHRSLAKTFNISSLNLENFGLVGVLQIHFSSCQSRWKIPPSKLAAPSRNVCSSGATHTIIPYNLVSHSLIASIRTRVTCITTITRVLCCVCSYGEHSIASSFRTLGYCYSVALKHHQTLVIIHGMEKFTLQYSPKLLGWRAFILECEHFPIWCYLKKNRINS